MKKVRVFVIAFFLILSACGEPEQPTLVADEAAKTDLIPSPTELPAPLVMQAVSGAQVTPMAAIPQPAAFDGLALPMERGAYFSTAGACSICHSKHVDADGNDVSIDSFWRATMMANSARDPYWQASIRAETLAHPELDTVIQDTCSTCHTPMARTTQKFTGTEGVVLDAGVLNPENGLYALGIDGTSCTLCHQINSDHFGAHESFDGNYVIDAALLPGERLNHGPYKTDKQSATIMQSTSGFIPQQGVHIQTSELCATCHTLYTPLIDSAGEVVGYFPEQMPYLEWLASNFAEQQSCQDCHMPEVSGGVVLSVTGGPARAPFSQHSFIGGNTYALSLLRHFGDEIGVTASSAQIEAAQKRAKAQLQERTAQINIETLEISGSRLRTSVSLSHQVGHKFPSGYPSRRVWIHLVVYDGQGNVVFESGNWSADGAIVGNDNDLNPAAFEVHYNVIDNTEQVQIYEAIMGDVDGSVTTTLLSGFAYLKDNRLPPLGFDKGAVDADIAVLGLAEDDANFQDGSDWIEYQIDLGEKTGPFTVSVELLYQSIGYRWAQNLAQPKAPEPERFLDFYQNLPNMPVVVAEDLAQAGE